VLKNSGNIYVFSGIWEKSDAAIHVKLLMDKLGFYFKDWITWKKKRGAGMRKGWVYTREEILWFVKDNKQFIWYPEHQYGNERRQLNGFYKNGKKISDRLKSPYKRLTNVWTDIPEVTIYNSKEWERGAHITPKPIRLLERIIKVHTKENDIVLDLFAGSGSTSVACKRLNRKYVAIEINKEYCDLIQKRLNKTESPLNI